MSILSKSSISPGGQPAFPSKLSEVHDANHHHPTSLPRILRKQYSRAQPYHHGGTGAEFETLFARPSPQFDEAGPGLEKELHLLFVFLLPWRLEYGVSHGER
ncbi:hypothetical protein HPP92_001039 [Vanilla planifolia]|uniref:Uncharacterized protein n=1 Tax=Vanilla planifolia TaxID=51239 RepID=A0A835SB83_VANPL|nr:hypothetical protein HPP92_001039 [Vanilla planifolia]